MAAKERQRLDKILAHLGFGTRKDIKKMIRDGRVMVNSETAADAGVHVTTSQDLIEVDGQPVRYRQYIYLMMNKPQGVLSATEDSSVATVVDLLDAEYQNFNPFPVGRLDKDTEGLLLLTNDGKLSHQLLSPRRHVPKTYFAAIEGAVTDADTEAFAAGVVLDDGYATLPGYLKILKSGPQSEIELTIYEGKFHQVKRMFEAVGKRVAYLKRITMGPLQLDETLGLGEYREITDDELELLQSAQGRL